MARNSTRTPPPRQLGNKETLESLLHWRTTFKTFYKKDDTYKRFFKANTKWDHCSPNYGLQDDEEENRLAPDLADDLSDLLHTLAGYLPHAYLTDKILFNTKCWDDVWTVINDHYNVQVSSETLLDFESMYKQDEETYRQFYERLLQHVKQHLAPANVKVESITNTAQDAMSISLMNLVALQWLRKIDPNLISIIRIEYSTELRANIQLEELVPRIAPNIDALRKRYDSNEAVNAITLMDRCKLEEEDISVNKTWFKGSRASNRSKKNIGPSVSAPSYKKGSITQGSKMNLFCPSCYYLSQQLETSLHFKHTPGECPRKAVAVKMLQLEDSQFFQSDKQLMDNGKDCQQEDTNFMETYDFQTPNQNPIEKCSGLETEQVNAVEQIISNTVPEVESIPISLNTENVSDFNTSALEAKVLNLQNRRGGISDDKIRKSKSPCIWVQVQNVNTHAVLDEGSEINCMDHDFAVRNEIQFVPTHCVARAAGSNTMVLAGETKYNVTLTLMGTLVPVVLSLGRMVIVKNLGVDILVGEPGKADNKIVTYPHKQEVGLKTADGQRVLIPYSKKDLQPTNSSFHCKSNTKQVIYPGQSLDVEVPFMLRNHDCFSITQQTHRQPWIKSQNVKMNKDGVVKVRNESNNIISLSKHEHFATMVPCDEVRIVDILNGTYVRKIYDINRTDLSHLIPHQEPQSTDCSNDNYLKEISLDPDDILPIPWKQKFYEICQRFSHLITPRPGKYNGFFGRIDNSINFSSIPPPSTKARLPKYNHEVLKIMAEKMDRLEEWGVLKKPEDIGVVPEFVLPSMLTPKTEEDEWRLVTDFTPLNTHIKKLETVSPTIKEAKNKLAKFKYHIQLDLSNYFYQGGMKIEDCQYLATPHPFKGLRVYVCEPQGLKNASEHAYERLGLVYGDMCAEEKLTRMADGLFVLADTLPDLEKNFIEVLTRAELCGFTFKPSKVIITPYKSLIFGWKKIGSGWHPTTHMISPLVRADPPTTVKQTRSWVGSFKQLTECIPDYAILLGPLERIIAGRSSAEKINWTNDLILAFNRCKKALNDARTIHIPKPSDVLHTWSDYSDVEKAVGGRMEIHRTENGKTSKLLGGHFSCRINKHQRSWYPCEGEALATRLVLEHFSHFIRENKNLVIHHTDNQPVVQAWRRSKSGAFSASARIASFLTGVSAMNVEIVHTPGREMKSSDYNSRHPSTCTDLKCQICKFAAQMESIGDKVFKVTVADIENGNVHMPYTQRAAWLKMTKHINSWHRSSPCLSPQKRRKPGGTTPP